MANREIKPSEQCEQCDGKGCQSCDYTGIREDITDIALDYYDSEIDGDQTAYVNGFYQGVTHIKSQSTREREALYAESDIKKIAQEYSTQPMIFDKWWQQTELNKLNLK